MADTAEEAEEGVPPAQLSTLDAAAQAVAGLLPKQKELLALLAKNDLATSAALAGDLAVAMRELQGELLVRASALPPSRPSDEGASIEGGARHSTADAFPELSMRLQEVTEALETHADELKGTQRQALVAERIKLASELESRQNAAYLTQLLTGNAVQRLVQALFGPEQVASAAATKRARMQNMASEVELLVNAKHGRKQLASTIRDYAGSTSTVAPQGFDCVCTLVSKCMGAMVSEAAPVFDELVVVKTEAAGQPPRVCGHLDWRTIGQDGATPEPPMGIESLCMPTCRKATAAASSTDGSSSANAGIVADGGPGVDDGNKLQTTIQQEDNLYIIIRTLDDGTRQYGFCALLESAQEELGGARVICVLSRHPWFQLFRCVLAALVSAAASEEPQDGVPATVVSILDALWHTTKSAFPMPGERFTVAFDLELSIDEGRDPLHLTRARDDEAPLRDAEFTTLFKCMGVSCVLAIYSALLAERHVLFVSSSYSRLCSCIHASMAMLYPFVWQHILVAILPESWLDYVTAPMPFVLGIEDSLLDRVLELPIEESLLIVKIDTGEIAEVVSTVSSPSGMALEDDGLAAAEMGAPCAALPASLSSRLEKSLGKMTNDLKKQRLEPSDFNRSVLDELVGGMAQLLGEYREYLDISADRGDTLGQDDKQGKGQIEQFDIDGLIASYEGEVDTQAFLTSLRRTQLFDTWCQERFALKAEGFTGQGQGLFEAKISEQDSRVSTDSAARAQSVDVETARYIIDASLTLQCSQSAPTPSADTEGNVSLFLLDRVRQHELWKNSSLWQRIFEEKLAAEANLELLTLDTAAARATAAATPTRAKRPTLGRRASMSVMLGRMGGTVSEDAAAQQATIAAAQEAAEAEADAHAKALKREAGKLSERIVQHCQTMMRFGLPLDLVERLSTKLAESHQLSAERVEKDVKLKVVSLIPQFVHLQPITKEGWLEVERAASSTMDGWDVRWFRIRDTTLCIHESDTHSQPRSVFPCAACEVSEPKSKRKGKEHVFRINVESHAVSAQDADSGSASKHAALKLIVNASSAEEKDEWYKHLQFGGAFVPTIARHTLRGDAKAEAVEALASMSAVSMKIRSGADHAVHAAAAKAAKAGAAVAGAKAKPGGVAVGVEEATGKHGTGDSDGGAAEKALQDHITAGVIEAGIVRCVMATPAASLAPTAIRTGWLRKEGKGNKAFKRRFFVLWSTADALRKAGEGLEVKENPTPEDIVLVYYESHDSLTPKGYVKVEPGKLTAKKPKKKRKGAAHCLRVDQQGSTKDAQFKLVLGDENDDELRSWEGTLSRFGKLDI